MRASEAWDKLTRRMPSTNWAPGDFIDFDGSAVRQRVSPTTISHTRLSVPASWSKCVVAGTVEVEDVTWVVEIDLRVDASYQRPAANKSSHSRRSRSVRRYANKTA